MTVRLEHHPQRFGLSSICGNTVLAIALLVASAPASAQTYQVSVEETGPLATVYTKRNNWRILSGFRHTTMIADPAAPTLCNESRCLDDDLSGGGIGPDLTRGGTASATLAGMVPGRYRVEVRYNQTVNRSTAVPWSITTDAASDNARTGLLNQRETAPQADKWLVLANSDQAPVRVASAAAFVFGSDSITFGGSLSYGGVRFSRVADLTSPDAGDAGDAGDSAACPELRSAEYSDPEATLYVAFGSTDRLVYTFDNVPNPAGLDAAALSMWLRDADHPGQEGMVFVNGNSLALPANPAWNDVTAQAVLAFPIAYVLPGHNVVEFGAGSLPTTVYAVSRVSLSLRGPVCAPATDAGPLHDASLDRWSADTARDTLVSDTVSGDTPLSDRSRDTSVSDTAHDTLVSDTASGDTPSEDTSREVVLRGEAGCACAIASPRRLRSGVLCLLPLMWVWRRFRTRLASGAP